MEKEFEKVHAKLDKLNDDMTEMKVAQARIEVSQDATKDIMDEHIKRTALAEESIKMQREHIDLLREEVRQELKPVKKHVQLVNNLFKFIIAFGSLLLFLNEMGWLDKFAAFLF